MGNYEGDPLTWHDVLAVWRALSTSKKVQVWLIVTVWAVSTAAVWQATLHAVTNLFN